MIWARCASATLHGTGNFHFCNSWLYMRRRMCSTGKHTHTWKWNNITRLGVRAVVCISTGFNIGIPTCHNIGMNGSYCDSDCLLAPFSHIYIYIYIYIYIFYKAANFIFSWQIFDNAFNNFNSNIYCFPYWIMWY